MKVERVEQLVIICHKCGKRFIAEDGYIEGMHAGIVKCPSCNEIMFIDECKIVNDYEVQKDSK